MESAITGRFRYKFRWIMTNLNLFRRIFDGSIWFSSIILSELSWDVTELVPELLDWVPELSESTAWTEIF